MKNKNFKTRKTINLQHKILKLIYYKRILNLQLIKKLKRILLNSLNIN